MTHERRCFVAPFLNEHMQVHLHMRKCILLTNKHVVPTFHHHHYHHHHHQTPRKPIFKMGAFYESIPKSLFEWILAQKIFWVATAPLAGTGHVNISPKGGAYFGLLNAHTFWYMDLTGSGSETIAHLYEKGNGRVTVLFNAFEGPPRILRIFGRGRVLENNGGGEGNGEGEFGEFVKKHDVQVIPGARAIVLVDVHQVGTSCGFSVPFFEYREHRETLNEFFARKEVKFSEGNEKESMPR